MRKQEDSYYDRCNQNLTGLTVTAEASSIKPLRGDAITSDELMQKKGVQLTIDEVRDALDDIHEDLQSMADELEGKDLSDLSTQNQFYVREAIKLMRSGSGYCEEAGTYLELDE